MDWLVILIVLLVVVAAGVATGTVVLTRKAVRAVRSSPVTRRAGELGGYVSTGVGVLVRPTRADRTAGMLATRVTAASVQLRREVAVAARAGAHLGEVRTVVPGLTDEAFGLSRELRRLTTCAADHADEVCAAARAHLAVVADVTAAVRSSIALPAAAGGIGDEATRVAAELRAYTSAYRDLVTPAQRTELPVPAQQPSAPTG